MFVCNVIICGEQALNSSKMTYPSQDDGAYNFIKTSCTLQSYFKEKIVYTCALSPSESLLHGSASTLLNNVDGYPGSMAVKNLIAAPVKGQFFLVY